MTNLDTKNQVILNVRYTRWFPVEPAASFLGIILFILLVSLDLQQILLCM